MYKLFRVHRYETDLCGNSFYTEDPVYVYAKNKQEINDYISKMTKFLGGYKIIEVKIGSLEDIK